MDSIPLPLPRSRQWKPGFTTFSMTSITIWVEGCAPVPKVRPGSRMTFSRSVDSSASQ